MFANAAEALAEGRGKAQADSLRAMRTETVAKLRDGTTKPSSELVRGDVVVVEAGEVIPGDGTVIEGIASVDESAITGESAPVIREAGVTEARSPAARVCFRTGSSSRSRRSPESRSWTG